VADRETVKLLKDVATAMANRMWHLQPHTEGGKLYERVEREIAKLECAVAAYTHADVTAAHTKGYELGMAQRTSGVRENV